MGDSVGERQITAAQDLGARGREFCASRNNHIRCHCPLKSIKPGIDCPRRPPRSIRFQGPRSRQGSCAARSSGIPQRFASRGPAERLPPRHSAASRGATRGRWCASARGVSPIGARSPASHTTPAAVRPRNGVYSMAPRPAARAWLHSTFVRTALPMVGFVVLCWYGLEQLMASKYRIRVRALGGGRPGHRRMGPAGLAVAPRAAARALPPLGPQHAPGARPRRRPTVSTHPLAPHAPAAPSQACVATTRWRSMTP